MQVSPARNLEMSPPVEQALRCAVVTGEGRCDGGDDDDAGSGSAGGDGGVVGGHDAATGCGPSAGPGRAAG